MSKNIFFFDTEFTDLHAFLLNKKVIYLHPSLLVANKFTKLHNRKKWQKEKHMKAFNLICLDKPYEEIDIVINTPIKFKTAYQKREEIKAGNLLLPLINLDNLIKMKKFSARKQDISDIESLQKVKKVKANESKIKGKRT